MLAPKLVAALCDRRFGIGADGVLRVVRTAQAGGAEWFMDYRNADGSIAEMCGNGVRVFARYLVETGLVAANEVVVETRSGPVVAVVTNGPGSGGTGTGGGGGDLVAGGAGLVAGAVSVTMTTPRVGAETTAVVAGQELAGVAVDCGNPHLVCLVPTGAAGLAGLDLTVPPKVDETIFPDGVNVEFIAPPPGEWLNEHHVRMRVHERGVGETLSCGSGACAVARARSMSMR